MCKVQSGVLHMYPRGALTEQNSSCVHLFHKYLLSAHHTVGADVWSLALFVNLARL